MHIAVSLTLINTQVAPASAYLSVVSANLSSICAQLNSFITINVASLA
jgi:hypothetical protein